MSSMFEKGYQPHDEKDAEDALYYQRMRVRCFEAKIERVDPDCDEFEDAMQGLYEARDEVQRLGGIILRLRYLARGRIS